MHMHLEPMLLGAANHSVVIFRAAVGNTDEPRLVGILVLQIRRARFDDTIQHELDVVAVVVRSLIRIADLGATLNLFGTLMLGLAIETRGHLELQFALYIELLEGDLGVFLVAQNGLVDVGETNCQQVFLQVEDGLFEFLNGV